MGLTANIEKLRMAVPAMHPHFYMLSYRIFDAKGDPLAMRNQSFFTSEEAFDFAIENDLHGFVLEVDRSGPMETWTLVDYTDPGTVLTEDEEEHLLLLTRIPGEGA